MKIKFSVTTVVLLASLGLSACGGGAAEAPYHGLGSPSAFVALATALPASAAEADKHFQMVNLAKSTDATLVTLPWCSTTPTTDPRLTDTSVVPITKLADQFYYTGKVQWGQHIIGTPDGGYVLIDTLGSGVEATTITIPQLINAGLDPAKLRAIVITHEHSDHDGGVSTLIARFGQVPTFMGTAGYSSSKDYLNTNPIDSANMSPQNIQVAGIPMIALPTPGHTVGTTSFIIPVTYAGVTHKLALWGGSAMPAGAVAPEQYMNSAANFFNLVWAEQADGGLNSHIFGDDEITRIAQIQANGGIANSDPIFKGVKAVSLYFATMRSCAAAVLALRDTSKLNPVWRPTSLDFYAAGFNTPTRMIAVAARLQNYFVPVTGASVEFSTASGESCTGITDAAGVATCLMNGITAGTTIKADFSGSAASGSVELPSNQTRVYN